MSRVRVRLHPHAVEQIAERGTTATKVEATTREGLTLPAKHGHTGFRRNFVHGGLWRGRWYAHKQVEAYAVEEPDGCWLVITVIVRFFGRGGG
jgi:hypothetical protein